MILKGEALYEALYRAGYGSEGLMVHYKPMLAEIRKLKTQQQQQQQQLQLRSVLDVGCSHGGGVNALWKMGLNASGVDISQTAVDMARRSYGEDPRRCIGSCWQQAPVTRLPFANDSFDAILSTDVLEHLEPWEVNRAVRELTRVARNWLFLKISNRAETIRMNSTIAPIAPIAPRGVGARDTFAAAVRKRTGHELPPQLHTTIQPVRWWVDRFATTPFRQHHRVGLESWACCGVVLYKDF